MLISTYFQLGQMKPTRSIHIEPWFPGVSEIISRLSQTVDMPVLLHQLWKCDVVVPFCDRTSVWAYIAEMMLGGPKRKTRLVI
jgi:hypothetical protein